MRFSSCAIGSMPPILICRGIFDDLKDSAMRYLYAWPTPNANKGSILLEEIGMSYNVIPVDISKGEQFEPEFLKISPNNRMPALVDHDAPGGPLAIFESGAIMMYIAEKSGRFLPAEQIGRAHV